MLAKLVDGTTGVKFVGFLLLLICATIKMHDDVQYALLIGGAYTVLVGGHVMIARKSLDKGGTAQ